MVMPVFLLAFGVVTTAFLTTLWNAGQLAVANGPRRMAHLMIVISMIAILAMLGLDAPETPIRLLAAIMTATAIWLFFSERPRHWPLCAIQGAFGLIVVAGLPFTLA